MISKWRLFLSGILHLLFYSQVFGDESCGNILVRHIMKDRTASGSFEDYMKQMVDDPDKENAGKSGAAFFKWTKYLMHQKNIGEVKTISQLRKDIVNFGHFTTANDSQTRDELSQILNVDFLKEKEDNAPLTALCEFKQNFTVNETTYYFPGYIHRFVIEKEGKDKFRLWQSLVSHYSAWDWLQGKVPGDKTPRDTNYTHGDQSLNRHEAKQLVQDLITFSDSNLDWNRRKQLTGKLFWGNHNIFFNDLNKYKYYDRYGKMTHIPYCEYELLKAVEPVTKDAEKYLSNSENSKRVEERRRNHKNCGADETLDIWFLVCDRNKFSKLIDVAYEDIAKCYNMFGRSIDTSSFSHLPKVQITMFCEVMANPNNGEQCAQNLKHINKIITENP